MENIPVTPDFLIILQPKGESSPFPESNHFSEIFCYTLLLEIHGNAIV